MIQVAHVSGSLKGESFRSPGPLIRVGRSAGCDLRYDADREPRVSYHHAELVFESGRWFVVDTDSEHGVLVNGKRVQRQPLRPGDRIAFGQGGPEVRVEAADGSGAGAGADGDLSAMRQEAYKSITTTRGVADEEGEEEAPEEDAEAGEPEEEEAEEEEEEAPAPPPKHRGANGRERPKPPKKETTSATKLAEEVAAKVAAQRKLAGGQSSGQTTFIMAEAIESANEVERQRTRKRWVRIVAAVLAGGALITSGLGVVIVRQRKQLEALVNAKKDIDQEIAAVEAQMTSETDPDKLLALEAQLQSLTGQAKGKLDELGEAARTNEKAREALAQQGQGDELDREMRAVLGKFGADTYAIPPVFKERVRWHIDWLVTRKNWPQSQERWKKYWPSIRKAFQDNGVPEELGYIAYVESQFDAEAFNDKAGARGMWQFIPATAKSYGLRVDSQMDERTNPYKAADAAAKYLSALLIEFGEQSFMLVLASYNKGEDGVRKALHKVAKEPGGYKKRDFWHLYRMKLLPDETREYVPAVIAAAIVFGNPLHYGGPTLPQ
ncbi:MAG TPA: transglycosylase SLT domain-containing protein [Myxococcaceae bacterium]|nr:transglycosylase SLT domain-containing protein [Myxococcaceae bacterium]